MLFVRASRRPRVRPVVDSAADHHMAKKKVADLLVEVLAEASVRRVLGVSGDFA